MLDLKISVVLYHTKEQEIRNVLRTVNQSALSKEIYLIDNSRNDALRVLNDIPNVTYIFNNANLGYGKGHNLAINHIGKEARYHLVINSDIEFKSGILQEAFNFMESNPGIGMLSPKILDSDGSVQLFCRKLPDPFDLFARRFIPGFIKPLLKRKLEGYVLASMDYSKPMNVPNLPGCFMFMRAGLLKELGGFDEKFFLYVEDVDLTRRLNELSITLYYPEIEIVHQLAQGSYKFTKLVGYHIRSAITYFNKWGWFIDRKRSQINKTTGTYLLLPPVKRLKRSVDISYQSSSFVTEKLFL